MAYNMEPMLELYIYETSQMLTNMERMVMEAEDQNGYDGDAINEMFRAMHTIKGSSAMMMYDQVSKLAHAVEDVFDLLRSHPETTYSPEQIADFVLNTVDFVKLELEKVQNGKNPDGDSTEQIVDIKAYLQELKGEKSKDDEKKKQVSLKEEVVTSERYYIPSVTNVEEGAQFVIIIWFSEDCVMENIRAYTLMTALKAFCTDIESTPSDLLEEDANCIGMIRKDGFQMQVRTKETELVIVEYLTGYPFVDKFEVLPKQNDETEIVIDLELDLDLIEKQLPEPELEAISSNSSTVIANVPKVPEPIKAKPQASQMISVHVDKLDKLMDLVGELVVSEAMLTRNPTLQSVVNDMLEKTIRQHRKIITDMQDISMAIRMVPLSTTFQKMKRLVRDVSHSLNKNIELVLVGENTEVDKNIIEQLSDPLMHLIRNACDHGIEMPNERREKGKPEVGTIVLEAKNSGGDVWIIIKDNGKGLNADKIYEKALEKKLIGREEPRPSDKELYHYIFMAGFSTKEEVSEFSGRGVGMDVAVKNIEKIGGSITVTSTKNEGSNFLIKIPLTLTIINGMRIRVGNRGFILPITSIKESFRLQMKDYVKDPNDQEIVLVRGQSYTLLRLNTHFKIKEAHEDLEKGIIIMIGEENQYVCLFADELLGEQQVVVKPLPKQIKRVEGISGCAILGDGGISLILDMDGLLKLV